ncbi:MAG: methylmalonyl-CoA mutase [Deltaproteobacteria bacterium]|nr:MAG: methylmalonyl-CoA mutase [Deltaproteobacteria bacterium]
MKNKKPVSSLKDERFKTRSGISLKRAYTPKDIEEIHYSKEIGEPGQFPYTRGIYPEMYRSVGWMKRQPMGFGSSELTAERYKALIKKGGQAGYEGGPAVTLLFDMPTNYCYDSDNPICKYQVGTVGLPVDHIEDMVDLMTGFPMDKGFTNMVIHGSPAILLAMYIAAAEELGYSPDQLRGSGKNDPFQSYLAERIELLPIEAELRLCMDILEYCTDKMPRWNPISVSGFSYHPAGLNSIQELGLTLATAIAYIQAGVQRGLKCDQFAHRISFFMSGGIDFLEEIAKFRAARRLWAKIMKDKLGASNPKSMLFRVYCLTLTSDYTAQQPLVNLIRGTIQGLAAVLGGVQALGIPCYDEALGIPTEESQTLSIRTQQVIAEESGVCNTVDPLGGSYTIEWLTKKIENEVYAYIEKIESMSNDGTVLDGLIAGIKSGILLKEITEEAIKRQKAVESGKITMIGLNKYREEETVSPPVFRPDSRVAKMKIQKLTEFKKKRDIAKVKKALRELREATESGENVMPTLIKAAKERVTLEEAMDVFRTCFDINVE